MDRAFLDLASTQIDEVEPPSAVKSFLKQHIDLLQFTTQKKKYLLLKQSKNNDVLVHLEQAYAQIHFWKAMCLSMVEGEGFNGHCRKKMDYALSSYRKALVERAG